MLSELQRINTGLSTLNRLPDGGRLAEHLGSKYSDLAPGKSIWRQSVLIMHFYATFPTHRSPPRRAGGVEGLYAPPRARPGRRSFGGERVATATPSALGKSL